MTVTVRDLAKRFGATTALEGMPWAARHGQVTPVLGPNCAGTTTTIECAEDFVAARCGQRVVLALGVLIAGGHSAVSDAHASDGIANGGERGEGADTEFFTNPTWANIRPRSV